MAAMYMIAVLATIICLLLIDCRYKLAVFLHTTSAVVIVLVSVVVLLIWDLAGIIQGVFFSGQSEFMSGLYIMHEVPIEEPFLLVVISYLPLLLYRVFEERSW